jgi:hypothetical protein
VLVGAGAIGNAVIWALSRAQVKGTIHVVDHERIELSNLQRYVLALRRDDNAVKVDLAAAVPRKKTMTITPHAITFADFVATHGYQHAVVAVSVDTARDRVAVQASLPRIALNGWTQPGDLGVSVHPHFGRAAEACVGCLYLPDGEAPNEDEIVANALRIPERLREVRDLLDSRAPLQRPLLEAIAGALGRPIELLLPFEGRAIRELYVRGVCGGAVIPLGQAGTPAQDVHVPLAHQSALAGVLLAAQLVRVAIGLAPATATVTTINVMDELSEYLTLPRQRRVDRRCICGDPDFVDAFEAKWHD